jgi:hypothetical protein
MHLRPTKSSPALHTVSNPVSPSYPCNPNHGALTRQGYRESRHNSFSLGLPGSYCGSPPFGALDRFASIAVAECVAEISVAKMLNAIRRSQLKFCKEPKIAASVDDYTPCGV